MKKIKRILKKIFFLPPLPTVLIALPSFTLTFYLLAFEASGAIAYVSYTLSAYSLVITVTGMTRIPEFISDVKKKIGNRPLFKKIMAHPLGGRFLTNAAFRTEVSLYFGLCINLAYAAIKTVSGIIYHSLWFITLSIYYILLAVMRFLLLVTRKKHSDVDIFAEFRRYRSCGVLLAFMTLALAGMVMFIIRREGDYDYPGALIYMMAMYAFYAVITAIINIVKFRKYGSPVLSAAKAINLTAALVSMLALETAMINRFGGSGGDFRLMMTAVSGGVVCAFVLLMAFYMIVQANRALKNPEKIQTIKRRSRRFGSKNNLNKL